MELTEVYTQFRKTLYSYIYSKINHKEDAEDILQNVFVKMVSHIETLSDEDKIQNWLYRITRNAVIDYYRVKGSKKTTVELIDFPEEYESNEIDSYGLDACLKGFIDQLPEEYKTIVIDSEIKGISQKELAVKYKIPYPTLRSRVQRGRERLHRMLLNCCVIDTDSRGNVMDVSQKGKNCDSTCGSCDSDK